METCLCNISFYCMYQRLSHQVRSRRHLAQCRRPTGSTLQSIIGAHADDQWRIADNWLRTMQMVWTTTRDSYLGSRQSEQQVCNAHRTSSSLPVHVNKHFTIHATPRFWIAAEPKGFITMANWNHFLFLLFYLQVCRRVS